VRDRGRILDKEELLDKIWPDTAVEENNLTVAMSGLRKALGEDPTDRRYIVTIPGRGYRFAAEVRAVRSLHSSWSSWPWLASLAGLLVVVLAASMYVSRIRARSQAPAAHHRVMLAVLPFANLSNDSEQEYFSDGLTEETITDLDQLSPEQLGVIARTSAMAYKRTNKTISQIGHELGVDYILEGSVRRERGEARISAQLIRVSDQTHLWAQNYDRKLQDLLEVQNEIGKAIAEQVRLNLTLQQQMEEQQRLTKRYTENPEAYQLYLKGRYYSAKATKEDIEEGRSYFQQAIEKDPKYALAYAGLAYYYYQADEWFLAPSDAFPKAKAAAEKALAMDETLAEAHTMLAVVLWSYDWDFAGAEREFKRALELDPGYGPADQLYGFFLTAMGRPKEGIAENQRALALDPLSLEINAYLGQSLYLARRYDESTQQLQRTLEIDPHYWYAHFRLGFNHLAQGRPAEAVGEFQKAISLENDFPDPWGGLGMAYGLMGNPDDAQKVLKELRSRSQHGYVPPYALARVYIGLGDKDRAFEWLEKSYQDRGWAMTWLRVQPEVDSLRSDPRFARLIRRMGLQQ
jgi:TolB-like protein/Tfp pilus assembly protein PilF